MTDAADRIVWESDEDALYRAARAQISTESGAQPENGSTSTDAATSDAARRDRYAELIDPEAFDPDVPLWMLPGSDREGATAYARRQADRVVAVADEELAGLRAEVERLRGSADRAHQSARRAGLRAEAAEARERVLREAVEALADEWEKPVDGRQEYATLAFACAADELRDALDSARVGAADTQDEGAGECLLADVQVQRCDSCDATELVLRYSPDHGANFCLPCYGRENPEAAADREGGA